MVASLADIRLPHLIIRVDWILQLERMPTQLGRLHFRCATIGNGAPTSAFEALDEIGQLLGELEHRFGDFGLALDFGARPRTPPGEAHQAEQLVADEHRIGAKVRVKERGQVAASARVERGERGRRPVTTYSLANLVVFGPIDYGASAAEDARVEGMPEALENRPMVDVSVDHGEQPVGVTAFVGRSTPALVPVDCSNSKLFKKKSKF